MPVRSGQDRLLLIQRDDGNVDRFELLWVNDFAISQIVDSSVCHEVEITSYDSARRGKPHQVSTILEDLVSGNAQPIL
jgi:hypothetical protein